MDPIRNPFAPGAGSRPPELAGRGHIIKSADIAIQRVLCGRHDKSQILLGLRGTGKTVLLNAIEELAEKHGHLTSFIEASEDQSLVELLYPKVHQVLRRLSTKESAKAATYEALRALRAIASAFKVKVGDFSISVDPEPGVADSGNLEFDMVDLFVRVGEAIKAARSAWTLLIDEIQYLSDRELAALIVANHRINQKGLPILMFGAGLPQVAALSGDAKSYAERLFDYPGIGPLEKAAAIDAIRQPIEDEEESIAKLALEAVYRQTGGYPYFLQEWGYQTWNVAQRSPFQLKDVKAASPLVLARLDDGFFKVRLERLTPKERDYVFAMASLGRSPYRSSDVADRLDESTQSLGPRRAKIISKRMIYSPAHGDIAFTVPMFEDYLSRAFPDDVRVYAKGAK
jgi:hypothetical protein